MKRMAWFSGMSLLVLMVAAAWGRLHVPARLIPAELAAGIPVDCRQLVVVRVQDKDKPAAEVWLMERNRPGGRWQKVAGPMAANAGKKGVAWGRGDPDLPNPDPGKYAEKREGDGRSPAGLFQLPFAFGAKALPPEVRCRLPWMECTPTLRGVDDPKSRYYNLVVDESGLPDKDWDSAEIMKREDGLYDVGVMIGHNPARLPGMGSCIFLHIWKGLGEGTAGCTALSADDVRKIVAWVDPAKEPRLALAVP